MIQTILAAIGAYIALSFPIALLIGRWIRISRRK